MRTSGVLLHISSLPSPWGIGTMGTAAREFVDFLFKSGQRYWQVLPIGPTSYGDSPYQPFSTFAGNPYFIDLDLLCKDGLLEEDEYIHLNWGQPELVDYGLLYQNRYPVLRKAVERLQRGPKGEYEVFCRDNADWLEDYALYMALKKAHNGAAWNTWEDGLKLREEEALQKARQELCQEIDFWKGVQYLFSAQWEALRIYAHHNGIALLGDLPIYVAYDSADVWSQPAQFQLDEEGAPIEVAGCPPDAFTDLGQLWGNPLFDWDYMKEHHYDWWVARIKRQFELFDSLRIDHFRGFDSYYAIPAGDKDARGGHWKPGPGIDLFHTVNKELGKRSIIAEDLGFMTESVRELLRDSGYPGMEVLHFAFDPNGDSEYLPHNHKRNSVVYVGTHDNETTMGWKSGLSEDEAKFAKAYLRISEAEEWNWALMRTAWASVSKLAIVTMQDLLGLDNSARMNTPSTSGSNWQWRMVPGSCTPELAERIYEEVSTYRRLSKSEEELV